MKQKADRMQAVFNYLQRYGYLSPDIKELTDEINLESPIREFQAMARIPVTGELDKATLETMEELRCGFPDHFGPTQPPGSIEPLYELVGDVWHQSVITYRMKNFTPRINRETQRAIIRTAVNRWAAIIPIEFREVRGKGYADIMIEFSRIDPDTGRVFNKRFATTFAPPPNEGELAGDIYFNAATPWQEEYDPDHNRIELLRVAVHEIGHSLGLGHTLVPGSTMRPNYPIPSTPAPDDKAGIKEAYREHIWVASMFRDFLERSVPIGEIDPYVRQLYSTPVRGNVIHNFLRSRPAAEKMVIELSRAIFDRDPEREGLDFYANQFMNWTHRREIITSLLESDEYQRRYPPPRAFVESLYRRLLGRAPDREGLEHWVNQMRHAGWSTASVIHAFHHSEEYCRKYIRTNCLKFLRREPRQADFDAYLGDLMAGLFDQILIVRMLNSLEYVYGVVRWW